MLENERRRTLLNWIMAGGGGVEPHFQACSFNHSDISPWLGRANYKDFIEFRQVFL